MRIGDIWLEHGYKGQFEGSLWFWKCSASWLYHCPYFGCEIELLFYNCITWENCVKDTMKSLYYWLQLHAELMYIKTFNYKIIWIWKKKPSWELSITIPIPSKGRNYCYTPQGERKRSGGVIHGWVGSHPHPNQIHICQESELKFTSSGRQVGK